MKTETIKIINMRSSFLTSLTGIAGLFLGAVIALPFHLTFLAAALILMAVIAILSRVWSLKALTDVGFSAESDRYRLFPGDAFTLLMKVSNRKNIPLIWLDAAVPLEDSCSVLPAGEEDIYEPDGLTKADDELPRCPMLRKRFAFISPWQELEIPVAMKAMHRGIYRLENLRIYSGDGFGLTQTGMTAQNPERVFAVYPEPAAIRAEKFLRAQWTSAGKNKGYLEDPTLIRGSRDYQPTDSWKRINWRMAARGLPLQVNLPEMILPQSSHFIVDGESFSGPEADQAGFELMLSILCGILLNLSEKGLECGLSLPASLRSPSVTLPPGTKTAELLFALAAYELKPYKMPPAGEIPVQPVSSFAAAAVLAACQRAGNIYYLTRSLRSADHVIVRKLQNQGVTVIPLEEPDQKEAAYFGEKIIPMRSLLKNT